MKEVEALLMTVDKNECATPPYATKLEVSSVHTVGHLRSRSLGRSRYSAWNAFHVSTEVITTTRVLRFKNFICFDDEVRKS